MKKSTLILLIIAFFLINFSAGNAFADNPYALSKGDIPQEAITLPVEGNSNSLVGFLAFIQKILLTVVLPLVAVGCGIYIAYELFSAEGDEAKLAQAWRSVAYSIIAIISIALSALVVSLISRLNIG